MKYFVFTILLWALLLPLLGSEFENLLSLEDQGIQNADLFYNIGVGYWQKGETASATLYFLKALNLDSAHKAATDNLEFLKSISMDKDLYPEYSFLQRVFLAGWAFMNLNRMSILSLLLLVWVALSFVWLRFYDPHKEAGLPKLVLGLALFFFLFSSSFLVYKAYHQRNNAMAVVLKDNVELNAGREAEAQRVALLNEGLIVKVLKQKDAQALVKLPNGMQGWLKQKDYLRVRE